MRHLRKSLPSYVVFALFFLNIVDATIEVLDSWGRKIDSFQDRETRFDDDIAMIEGYITLADPPDACTSIAEPTYLTNFTVGKFVLINGTEKCRLRIKVNNAEKAGFDLAVIFDPTSPYIHIVPYPGLETNIPVIFVSYEDGMTIKSSYLYNNSYPYNFKLRIKPNNPDIYYYMWLFGAVIGVCFFVMILFMICLLIKCIQERRKSRRNRLSSRQIRQIPTAKFAKGDQYDVCAICLENYNEGDKLRILPCSHAYHAKCIDPWLMNNRRNCPLCKRKITFGDSADDSDSEDSELTSPAENTPLLSSPSIRGQTWGTFVNPVLTVNSRDTAGPSSLPDTFQYSENSLPSSVFTTAVVENVSRRISEEENGATDAVFENPFRRMSKEDLESLLPPDHGSVNTSKVDNVIEENAAVVQVTINNSETANILHGLSV